MAPSYMTSGSCIQGHKTRFWPELSDFHPISLNVTSPTEEQLRLSGLRLQNGASYNVKVTAINRAKMATAEESVGVTVDTTPPVVLGVSCFVSVTSSLGRMAYFDVCSSTETCHWFVSKGNSTSSGK